MSELSRPARRRFVALAVLPAVLLTACVSVPFSGDVEAGGEVDTGVNVALDFLPSGPSEGASQEELLAGFFAATTASQNNYRIARSYLADDIADVWNPYAITLVRSREGFVERVDDETLSYSVPITASVDAVGRYAVADVATSQTLPEFRFVQEGGEWRIAELGDGILISQQAFPSVFSQHTLFYWDAAFRNLVPDLRWFPTRAEVATRIVRAVLEPPSTWLGQGATVSAIPEGTKLALAPVTISAGVAQVDLTNEVLALGDRERQRLRLQIAASLRGVSGFVGVEITVDGNAVAIPDWTADAPDIVPQVDPRVLALSDEGEFGFAARDGIEPIGALSDRVLELGATAVTLARTPTLAAVLAEDGVWAVSTGDAPSVLLDNRAGLIDPSIDGYTFVWSVPTLGGEIHATELDGTIHVVESALPDDTRIVSLDVSRDGARVLIMLEGVVGPRLVYAAVIRDEGSSVPIRLGEFRDLPLNGERPIDAAWVDEVRVASITASGVVDDEQRLVELHEIGGRSRPLGLPPEATQIVGGNGGVEGIRVLGSAGIVFEPRGSGWQNTGLRAIFLGTQQ
jgi:hypothetical protein